MFITIEGIDGGGKTTLIEPLKKYIEKKGYEVFLTREPGGTAISEEIRTILLKKRPEKIDGWTEALLFIASRKQHLSEAIIPALKANKIVICDRYMDSTTAYQGAGRGLKLDDIDEVQNIVLGEHKPDLTIYLDLNLQSANQRINYRRDVDDANRLDEENNEYKQKVIDGYHDLVQKYPNRFKVIDASLSKEEVINQAKMIIDQVLK